IPLFLELTDPRGILLALEILFDIDFALCLRRRAPAHIGTVVVAERAVTATTELKLDEILLHLHLGDEHFVATTDRSAKTLQALRVIREIARLIVVRKYINALVRAGHLNFHDDAATFEVL